MSETAPRRIAEIDSYHAHIYYDPATSRAVAEALRHRIGERFPVQLGRWHDVTVGPHVRAMYQVAFAPHVFPALVPWLMLNRAGLTVLVHPNTDNPHDDHLEHALWLGEKLDVKGEVLPHELGDHGHDAIVANTTPTLEP
jgi:DOPA 4,5-dioxygenase